tara:strand:+ start:554 stop:823 length:270 start_codon:yes stop_codon:yes gene_type:complete
MNYNTNYGAPAPYTMTAPTAPMGASQGAAMAGQQMLPAALTQKAQQTMSVPATPVKGLLQRVKPKAPQMGKMKGLPPMPPSVARDLGYA